MANETTISPTTEVKDVSYWIVLIWCVASVLVLVLVIVAIYYSYVICCQKKKGKHQSPYSQHHYPRHPMDNYPKAFIDHLHNGNINSRAMFSPSFVDHMRIPRAMEVKIIESVNSLNKSQPQPSYSPPTCHTPTRSINDFLNPEMFSLPNERIPPFSDQERMPPSRQQSFRYSNMSVEESKERIYKEKMLVSELREKLRNQRKLDE